MLLNIKDQIKLNYEFNNKLFDDDVDVDNIINIIKDIVHEFNIDEYDDIFLNIDMDESIKKFIKYKTNLLYKICTYHDDELINICTLYDPLEYYNDDVDIKYVYYIIKEYLNNDIVVENIVDYDEFVDINDVHYNKFELIDLFIENIDNIVDNIIVEIDDELNKTYNKIHHVKIKSL